MPILWKIVLVVAAAVATGLAVRSATEELQKQPAKPQPAVAPAAPKPKPARKPEPKDESEPAILGEPAAEKPAAEKPAAEKPAAEKPAAEKPAAGRPVAPKPAPRKLRRLGNDELTPEIVKNAVRILKAKRGSPYGTEVPFSAHGRSFVGRIEQHYHTPGGPLKPWGKHPGVSVFEVMPAAGGAGLAGGLPTGP